ncbi:hypothetical protein, partial [Bacillus paranthracis]|uniref:hypothetical protein n=1 Tax=Bacillus paranthracis TaxID=2026186 RepID=UPI001B34AEFE
MKYLLCALLLCGAFFSHSQEAEPSFPVCEPGETQLPMVGGCGVTAPEQSCKMTNIRWLRDGTGYGSGWSSHPNVADMDMYFSTYNESYNRYCTKGVSRLSIESIVVTHDLSPGSCPTDGSLSKEVTFNIDSTKTMYSSFGTQTTPMVCQYEDAG